MSEDAIVEVFDRTRRAQRASQRASGLAGGPALWRSFIFGSLIYITLELTVDYLPWYAGLPLLLVLITMWTCLACWLRRRMTGQMARGFAVKGA